MTSVSVFAQKITNADLESLSKAKAMSSLNGELRDFLSIPNNALIAEHVRNNLDYLTKAFKKRGFTTTELPTISRTALLAEKKVQGAEKTVLFYMHFDGQPIDPSKWDQPDAYTPVLKQKKSDGSGWEIISWDRAEDDFDDEWRVFARSASDDKSPIIMFLQAMDIMAERKQNLNYNIKVILDPEEEQGSIGLPGAVKTFSKELTADRMIILDGPIHDSNLPTLVFGTRGIAEIELTVYGPRTSQHSGHFGNYAPNPALRLSKLLGSMKDDEGKVTLPTFYDGIELTASIKAILRAVPDDQEQIKKRIGIAETDKVGSNYQEAMQYPSLNIRGFRSGWVGDEARTIVPDKAVATMDIRLVPESDGARLVALVKRHVKEAGYYLIENREPTEEERLTQGKIIRFDHDAGAMWKAFYTPVISSTGLWLYETLSKAHNSEVARIRLAGGSVPIAFFVQELKIPAVLVPLVNPDNGQHSPNENLRLGHYRNGIKSVLAILNSDY
ncbi:MAG: acetylornithine deacetylase/succinyl-diaminopimelate desuccinylase-like protein [Roseivirga sp.]|jgi:acetylornithine deacetylase/succinyl-diaminopimelate desuccinylase-like protein